jgi:membrane protein YqaA with SNARE-associated domain
LSILNRLNEYLLYIGIPGLLAISFIDSAAIPLAGGPDAVVLLLSWQEPSVFFLFALTAAVGSTLGCLVLYGIGWKGGKKALARFSPRKREWAERKMREYGIWIIIVSVIAPPPFPTKLVILGAGVLRTGRMQLISGVFIGRILRYSLLAYLGAEFGDDAVRLIRENYPIVSIVLVAVFLLIILIRRINKNR